MPCDTHPCRVYMHLFVRVSALVLYLQDAGLCRGSWLDREVKRAAAQLAWKTTKRAKGTGAVCLQ